MRRAIFRSLLPVLLIVGLVGCPDEGAPSSNEAAAPTDEAAAPAGEAAGEARAAPEAAARPVIQPAEGAEQPQMAVVEWLDAVNAGDYEAAAALAPPTFNADARKALADDLEEALGGARRLDDVPFAMSPPEGGRTFASVTLGMPDGGRRKFRLDLVQVGGRWFAEPTDLGEASAGAEGGTGAGIVPAGEAEDAGEADAAPAPPPEAPSEGR